MGILYETSSFPSSDGSNSVSVKWWIPEAPVAVLQLTHGMAEYAARYDAAARFFADHGFAVCADDHLGHGDTAPCEEELGFMGSSDGYLRMADDMHTLTGLARKRFPQLPLVLYGHSMGSFLARLYASKWSGDIDALVVCGTAGPNPLTGIGSALASLICLVSGEKKRSGLLNAMAFGSYLKGIDKPKGVFDWLSVDRANIEAYEADPFCGFTFTAAGFKDLFHLLRAVSEPEAAGGVRKDLPVLFVSGSADPVGSYGKGVVKVRDMFAAAGVKDVSLKLYDGARHEILNDFCRDEVKGDLLDWCIARVGKK